MANHDTTVSIFNPELRMLTTKDKGHADVFNELFGTLIKNDVSLKKDKVSIEVNATLPPIEERKENTFYLKVTDQQSVQEGSVKVSPNMGLKIL